MTASHEEKTLPEVTLNTTSSATNIGYNYYHNFSGALVPSYCIGLDKFIVVHSYRQGKRTTGLQQEAKMSREFNSGYSMNGREHKTLLCQCVDKTLPEVSKEAEKTSIAATKTDGGESCMLLWENSSFK